MDRMRDRRWLVVLVSLIVIGLVVPLVASLATSSQTPSPREPIPSQGPTVDDLRALAADLSSGDTARVVGAIADLPPGSEQAALRSLGDLSSVEFDEDTLRFDPTTGAAVVQVRLTDTAGGTGREVVALVKRGDRWLLFNSLLARGATPTPLG
jgi:hypothetical protein